MSVNRVDAETFVDLDYDDLDPIQLLQLYGMLMRAIANGWRIQGLEGPTPERYRTRAELVGQSHRLYNTLMNKLFSISDIDSYVSNVHEIMYDYQDEVEERRAG